MLSLTKLTFYLFGYLNSFLSADLINLIEVGF